MESVGPGTRTDKYATHGPLLSHHTDFGKLLIRLRQVPMQRDIQPGSDKGSRSILFYTQNCIEHQVKTASRELDGLYIDRKCPVLEHYICQFSQQTWNKKKYNCTLYLYVNTFLRLLTIQFI